MQFEMLGRLPFNLALSTQSESGISNNRKRLSWTVVIAR